MIDPLTTRRVLHRVLFVALCSVVLFVRLLPIDPTAHGLPGPDLMLALTLAWVLRRPDYVPAVLIVMVFIFEDMMLWRPIGLWPLIVLMATEWLRRRETALRDMPFLLELALVGGVMLAMLVVQRLILQITMVDQPALGLELLRWLVTLAAYPLVAGFSLFAFGLRRAATGEVDAFGQRL